MQTYLFYDIETTGFSRAYDQIVQFAAIRTDNKLKELERHEFKIKLNSDVIPSPGALITHHMGIHATADGLSEYDAIKKIHALMNQPGTISLGYNTIGFDDEFLRFSFYRNLLPPYTHQYANQCSRMDLYPMAVMFFLYKKNVLNWPENKGKISLKLADLKTANQLTEGRSHDAMVDVEATLALAQHFIAEREMWDYLSGYFNKSTEQERLASLKNTTALLVQGKLGTEQNFQCPVMYIGTHQYYRYDAWLKLDFAELQKINLETVSELNRYIAQKKIGEPPFILPLKDRFQQQIKPERLQLAEENKRWLQQQPGLLTQIAKQYTEFQYPLIPNLDAQAALYQGGFWNQEEERFCLAFHKAAPKEKARLVTEVKNPRLKTLAMRIIARHFPQELSAEQIEHYKSYLQQLTMVDHKGEARLTPLSALQLIAETRAQPGLDSNQLNLLEELEQYLQQW